MIFYLHYDTLVYLKILFLATLGSQTLVKKIVFCKGIFLLWKLHKNKLLHLPFFGERLPKCHWNQEVQASQHLVVQSVNNGNTRIMCEIGAEVTINTPKRRQWRRSSILIVNFEQISHIVLVFPLSTLNK